MGDSTPPEIAEASIEYCSAVSKFSMIFFFSLELGPFICAMVADWRFLSFFILPMKFVEILLPIDLIRPLLPKRLERYIVVRIRIQLSRIFRVYILI